MTRLPVGFRNQVRGVFLAAMLPLAGFTTPQVHAEISVSGLFGKLVKKGVEAGVQRLEGARDKANGAGGPAGESGTADNCVSQLPHGRDPEFINIVWAHGLTRLCRSEYVLAYSSKTRTALWSAEHLTRGRVLAARKMVRDSAFYEEQDIPAAARGRLRDFARSGYDRGHLAPSGDMSSQTSQRESFSLANIVPQDPKNNRFVWESIESGTRDRAVDLGSLFVVTGPLFQGSAVSFVNDRIAVPSHLWKLLYDARSREGGVFLVENSETTSIRWVPIADFEQLSGYRFGLAAPKLMRRPATRQHYQEMTRSIQ